MVKKPTPARQTVTKTIRQSETIGRNGDIHVNVEVESFSGASVRRQAGFWLGAMAFFVLFLVVFSSVLLPFVAGMALAYFLDPVADRLEKVGLSRLAASIVILLIFLMILIIGLMIVVPILATQLADFISNLPGYITQLQSLLANRDSEWLKKYIGIDSTVIQQNLSSLLQQGAGFLSTLLQSLWNSGKSLIDIAGLFVVTPVVAFYMLLDWDRMVNSIDSWVPRKQLHTVRRIAREMNAAVAGFIRGQGTLCLILGTYYAIGLTLTGLNFGLLIGFFAGLISFIPYIGSFVGLALAIGVALVQFWPDWIMVCTVAAVFFLGQFIEGNILQPKLVGSSVGLHPVWLMFALFAFGSLFGFTGMLVAVPAAAAVGVLVRFALNSYLRSPMYDPANNRSNPDAGPLIEAGDNTGREKWDGAKIRWDLMGAAMHDAPRQIPLNLEHQPGYNREDLIVTASNRAAVDLIDRWPNWLSPVTILAGPTGAGKTHLAEIWRSGTDALLVDPSNITEEAVNSAAERPVLIDNIGAEAFDETGLFHLINSVRQHAAQGPGPSLLMTSRLWPANWNVKLPDLASRLKAATVVEIAEPDDMLLSGVIHKLFADRQVSVEPHVVSYLVSRMERSLLSAIQIVDRLDRAALEQKSRITRALAAQILADMGQAG